MTGLITRLRDRSEQARVRRELKAGTPNDRQIGDYLAAARGGRTTTSGRRPYGRSGVGDAR
ncbi:hypothetical protein [Sphaerisporangium album]|uniref:hypothetical protein n=1 Tax=Sphaerisporangium album TaxID=509200 RepID=UPI0015F079BC|nr:hypothetical protein [Sphaerisporangium album]